MSGRPSAPAPGHVVLVVDDDDANREALRGILRDEGYTVYCAGSGAVAMGLLQVIPLPCLIVLDLVSPVLNGRAVVDDLRADDVLKHVPVVILSASLEAVDVSGVQVLKKPFDMDALLAIVRDLGGPPFTADADGT